MRRIVFLLAAATGLAAHTNGALADTGPCHSMEYERAAYTICEVDLRRHTVRLYWTRSDGTPYAYLSALPRDLEGGAGRLLFATNAGMFDSKLKPVGLYVEAGAGTRARKHQVRQRQFPHEAEWDLLYIRRQCGRRGDASISKAATSGRPSNAIRADAGDGWALASSFQPGQHVAQIAQLVLAYVRMAKSYSPSLRKQCHLTAFARLFRDGQKCPNALFLDGGSASSLYAPTLNRSGNVLPLGPMLAVFETNRAAPGQ